MKAFEISCVTSGKTEKDSDWRNVALPPLSFKHLSKSFSQAFLDVASLHILSEIKVLS